jgi:metal-responsive CopG/Arc/MetJ family transcriptional regulator
MAKPRKAQHGGRRAGSGRPAIYEDRGKISIVLENSHIRQLTDYAKASGVSRSLAVAQALRQMLGDPNPAKKARRARTS